MLKTENIHYSVDSKKILQGITTDFEPGLFHVIVGPNGSGKSTFLKVFSGELKPQQGNILYNDENVFKRRQDNEWRSGFSQPGPHKYAQYRRW